jgi:hypothetical protein
MTPAQESEARSLAAEGLSARAIGKRVGVSHVAVAALLKRPAPVVGSTPPPKLEPLPPPELAYLDAPPPSKAKPAQVAPAKPDPMAAVRADLEAEAATDNLRGTAELRAIGWAPRRSREPSPPVVHPQEQALRDEYHARHAPVDGAHLLRAAWRSSASRRTI